MRGGGEARSASRFRITSPARRIICVAEGRRSVREVRSPVRITLTTPGIPCRLGLHSVLGHRKPETWFQVSGSPAAKGRVRSVLVKADKERHEGSDGSNGTSGPYTSATARRISASRRRDRIADGTRTFGRGLGPIRRRALGRGYDAEPEPLPVFLPCPADVSWGQIPKGPCPRLPPPAGSGDAGRGSCRDRPTTTAPMTRLVASTRSSWPPSDGAFSSAFSSSLPRDRRQRHPSYH